MAYKNLLYRLFVSLIILLIYFVSLSEVHYLLFLGIIIYLIVFTEVFINFKIKFFYINIYLITSLLCFVVFVLNYYNFYLINLAVFVIIFFDTFSYFIGSLVGKSYIFKKLSPKKTLEGYLGGIFFTNISAIPLFVFFNQKTFMENLLLINVLIFFSIYGDLSQSYFKRINSLKDSSNFLPGHGGFFDRFDSFISTIIFLTFYSYLV